MTFKINQQASENNRDGKDIEREVLNAQFFLKKKVAIIRHGLLIPDDLIADIDSFRERNSLAKIRGTNGNVLHQCCNQCLKAHILKTAKRIGLDQGTISYIYKMIKCETGHDGYYLDSGLMKKVFF